MLDKLKHAGNRYVVALHLTVLTVAWIHLLILAYQALATRNFGLLHIGSILDLQFVLPAVRYDLTTLVACMVPAIVFYLYLVHRLRK